MWFDLYGGETPIREYNTVQVVLVVGRHANVWKLMNVFWKWRGSMSDQAKSYKGTSERAGGVGGRTSTLGAF